MVGQGVVDGHAPSQLLKAGSDQVAQLLAVVGDFLRQLHGLGTGSCNIPIAAPVPIAVLPFPAWRQHPIRPWPHYPISAEEEGGRECHAYSQIGLKG